MKIKSNYEALIIIGAWNRAIFTPDWVAKFVFPGEEMTIEIPVDNIDASPRYSSKDLSVNIIGQKLVFSINNPSQENFQQMGLKAIAVCRALTHTPLLCFGINHYFQGSKNEIESTKVFDFSNYDSLNEKGYELKSMRNQQSLQFEHHILNVIWSLENEQVTLEFNNHYNVSDVESFISVFDENLLFDRLNNSIDYIKNIYNLSVES